MIIVMNPKVSEKTLNNVVSVIEEHGVRAHISKGDEAIIVGIVGDKTKLSDCNLQLLDGVEKIVHVTESYKLANKKYHVQSSVIQVGNTTVGGNQITMIAGPCAIESEEQILETALRVKEAGATMLRGGAYKPRTSPYSFQGLEEQGLKYMAKAREATGLPIVCEVTSKEAVDVAGQYVDMFQIGARNMQNFYLLREVGKTNTPVMLKRGIASTIEEWLNAAEYIMSEGNKNVILCERGIRTYETATRNTLDISAIPVLKSKTHLPILVDPSHATGVRDFVPSLSRAAIAVGADGLMVEVHPNPAVALSDGPQSLTPEGFKDLMKSLRPYAELGGRTL